MKRMQDGLAGPNGGAEDVDGTFNGGRETVRDLIDKSAQFIFPERRNARVSTLKE